jgi:hypothetical protein
VPGGKPRAGEEQLLHTQQFLNPFAFERVPEAMQELAAWASIRAQCVEGFCTRARSALRGLARPGTVGGCAGRVRP